MTKYILIALLIVIISLLLFVGFQYIKLEAVKKQNENLKIENKRLANNIAFIAKVRQVEESFTNSSKIINTREDAQQGTHESDNDIKNTINSINNDYNNSMRLPND